MKVDEKVFFAKRPCGFAVVEEVGSTDRLPRVSCPQSNRHPSASHDPEWKYRPLLHMAPVKTKRDLPLDGDR